MKTFNIKVTEYGIKKGDKVFPSHYTWQYCIHQRIPYIIIRPQIKYSNIDYDLLTIDNGIAFKKGYNFIEHWWKVYDDYVFTSSFPKSRIPRRLIGNITDNFTVFRKDQEAMVNKLLKEIEEFVNKYGEIDIKIKKRYDEIDNNNELSRQADKYFESLNKGNKK